MPRRREAVNRDGEVLFLVGQANAGDNVQFARTLQSRRETFVAVADAVHVGDYELAGAVGQTYGVEHAVQYVQIREAQAIVGDAQLGGDTGGQGQELGIGEDAIGTHQFGADLGELAGVRGATGVVAEDGPTVLPAHQRGLVAVGGRLQVVPHDRGGKLGAEADRIGPGVDERIHLRGQIAAGFTKEQLGGFQDRNFQRSVAEAADEVGEPAFDALLVHVGVSGKITHADQAAHRVGTDGGIGGNHRRVL